MIDIDCALGPLEIGETRLLRISGDGPFEVRIGYFVSDPPPLGLQPGPTPGSQTVAQGEAVGITADPEFWSKHRGGLQIDIEDASGARRRLHINVRPASRNHLAGIVRA